MRAKGTPQLTEFRIWMETQDVAPTTIALYAQRIGTLLVRLGCPSEDLAKIRETMTEGAVKQYVGLLPTGSQPAVTSAWGNFLRFAQSKGVSLPDPWDRGRRHRLGEPTADTPLHPEAQAIWDLFRRNPDLDPTLVMALQWQHVLFYDGSTPAQASRAEIRDEGVVHAYRAPLTAFERLWNHARGDHRSQPEPKQPLVAAERGSEEAATPREIQRIVKMGKAGLIPRIAEGRAGRAALPPKPPPLPPQFPFPPPSRGEEEEE